jgi:glycosyltransferase involved in cell wall biosynthesis
MLSGETGDTSIPTRHRSHARIAPELGIGATVERALELVPLQQTKSTQQRLNVVTLDYSGHPGQMHLSRTLAKRGHKVLHLHCPSYASGKGALEKVRNDPDDLSIAAVSLNSSFSRYNYARRLFQEFAFARRAHSALTAQEADAFILSNVPLVSHFLLTLLLRSRKSQIVFWQQDVYSQAIAQVARKRFRTLGRLIGWAADRIESQIARGSGHVVAISNAFWSALHRWDISPASISIIPNWAPLDEMPTRPKNNGWAQKYDLAGRPTLMYSGTLGLKHNPEVLWRMACRLREEAPSARLVVISQGAGRDWLQQQLAETPTEQLLLLDYQPYAELPDVLASADILIAILESEAGQYSVPSKVLNYLCSGRPILGVMPRQNAASMMIEEAKAGWVVDSGRPDEAVTAAILMLQDEEMRQQQGLNARAYAEAAFDVDRVADKFIQIIQNLRN